jgi:hypothetical protein
MPTPKMTESEIISYLSKTSLPTLLVEGEDDAGIYRWLESQLGIFTGSILICSGRNVLLSIYRRRSTFPHGKIAWLADLDVWRYSSPPVDLVGVIFTTGYSIENDLYVGSDIESLLEPAERSRHAQLLGVVCRWFAFEILESQAGRAALMATHINRVVDFSAMDISVEFRTFRNFTEPEAALVNQLVSNYKLQLRGKTLLQVLVNYLSDSSRNPKYSYGAIIELCLKLYPNNPYIQRILREARACLA